MVRFASKYKNINVGLRKNILEKKVSFDHDIYPLGSSSHRSGFQGGPTFGSNWNLEMLVFEERGKPEYPEKNVSEQINNPPMTSSPGIEHGPHWGKTSGLTTTSTLLPIANNSWRAIALCPTVSL